MVELIGFGLFFSQVNTSVSEVFQTTWEVSDQVNTSVSVVFLNHLRLLRHGEEGPAKRAKRRRVDFIPGRSIGARVLQQPQKVERQSTRPTQLWLTLSLRGREPTQRRAEHFRNFQFLMPSWGS